MCLSSPKSFLRIILYFACYHTDASLLYQCVIEGNFFWEVRGTTLGQLWTLPPRIQPLRLKNKQAEYNKLSPLRRCDTLRGLKRVFQRERCGVVVFCFFFYYFAEGSNFLQRGSTHPPSFPMFHSPELKMEFEESRCPATSPGDSRCKCVCFARRF